MKPNMIKKWSVALLVAAGATGLVGCGNVRDGKSPDAAALTSNEETQQTPELDFIPATAKQVAIVQNDIGQDPNSDQTVNNLISPTSTTLQVLDSTWSTKTNNVGVGGVPTNEADRLDIVYNAIRDRFDGIYDNTNDSIVETDVATVSVSNIVKGNTYTVDVKGDSTLDEGNTVTGAVIANVNGSDDVAATVSIDRDDNLRYSFNFIATADGTANINLSNVGIGYTVDVSDGTNTATVTLKDDFAPLVALQHADRNGQDKTNYNNDNTVHDSIGMLVEYGEAPVDEAGEPINGNAQIFYPKLNLTASLYDECHFRSKSENIDVNSAESQEPINASELDASYYTTPLLATSKTQGGTYSGGSCPTESTVGKTCATNRSDRYYNANDYDCWYGTVPGTRDTCRYFIPDPGSATSFYEVTSVGGNTITSSTATASAADITTALITAGKYANYTFPNAVTFTSDISTAFDETRTLGFKGHPTLGPTACTGAAGTPADVARNIVIDFTEEVASISNSDNTTALQASYEASGNLASTTVSLASDSLGLLHLETPDQHKARAKTYHADTASSTISDRKNHLIATIGDWRTINENRRFISNSQDVIQASSSTLYGPEVDNVFGPDEATAALRGFHFGLRAEDYVRDSESDGMNKNSILKFVGEADSDNSDLKIVAGHSSGVVMVDATPAMATAGNVDDTATATNVNADSTITLTFDQNLLDDASYPEYSYLDLHGDDYVYRVDLDDNTAVRGTALAESTGTLGADEVIGDAAIAITVAAVGTDTLYAGSKIKIQDSDPGYVHAAASAGDRELKLSGLELGFIAEGSIIQIGNGERAHRYRIVDDGAGNGYVDVQAATNVTFVISPPLRADVLANKDVIVEKTSIHTVINNETGGAGGVMGTVEIYPTLPSNYDQTSTVVTVLNGITNSVAANEYIDAFGLSTGAFPFLTGTNTVNTVAAAVGVSNSGNVGTMTITVSDTTPVAQNLNSTSGAYGGADDERLTVPAGESVDMGAFFSDLSHTSTASVGGTATAPDFFVNYEDVQDNNFNSWAKVDVYDNYDNGRSPLLVGSDNLTPKLAYATQDQQDVGNTFLYDVTTLSGITVTNAHGNRNIVSDDDTFYTYDSTATFATANDEDDYPFFRFFGNDISGGTNSVDTTSGRVVIKLAGVSTISTMGAQSYFYSPNAVDIDRSDASDGDACELEQNEVEQYIHSTALASTVRLSDATNQAGITTIAGSTTLFTTADVDSDGTTDDDNHGVDHTGVGRVGTDGTNHLILGINDYIAAATTRTTDLLVVEDVLLDGVPYTLHFSVPSYSSTTSETVDTASLPGLTVYRKVSVSGMDLLSSGAQDDCSPGNIRAGHQVDDTYAPVIAFNMREHVNGTPTVVYSPGTDTVGATDETVTGGTFDDDRVDFTAESNSVGSTTGTENQVTTTLNVNKGITNFATTALTGESAVGFIGHGAKLTFSNLTDFGGNTSSFEITLNLGHGVLAAAPGAGVDQDGDNTLDANEGAIDEDNAGNPEIVDPILNVISGTAVE